MWANMTRNKLTRYCLIRGQHDIMKHQVWPHHHHQYLIIKALCPPLAPEYPRQAHHIHNENVNIIIVNAEYNSDFSLPPWPPRNIRHGYWVLLEYNTAELSSHPDAEISMYHYHRHCGPVCKNFASQTHPLILCQFERNKSSSYLCFAGRQLVTCS